MQNSQRPADLAPVLGVVINAANQLLIRFVIAYRIHDFSLLFARCSAWRAQDRESLDLELAQGLSCIR